jgi:hypothetical protein
LVEDRLKKHPSEEKATYHKEKRRENFKRRSSQSQANESSSDEKRKVRKENTMNIIAQARVNNARYAWREENYEDDEKEMGVIHLKRIYNF